MKNWLTIMVFAVIAFAGCKSTNKDLVPEEKMVTLLTEIHIAEGRMKTVSIFGDSARKIAPVLYDQIYKEQQVTQAEFLHTYHYYQNDPQKFLKLMEKVAAELSKKESGIK